MRISCDSHIHSYYSSDSSASIDAMCQGAIGQGLTQITFTEHCDLNPNDPWYDFFDPERFVQELEVARHTFAGRLTILKGVEFSEPHLYPDRFCALQQQDYDLIMGSIHCIGDLFVGASDILSRYTVKTLYTEYYQVMLASVHQGGFDTLAHFDFPKRYLKVNETDLPIIDEILRGLATAKIALEINTSALRKGLIESIPDRDILRRYAGAGGIRITVGSDAHTPHDVGADFQYVERLLEEFPQFEVGYFERRRFVRI